MWVRSDRPLRLLLCLAVLFGGRLLPAQQNILLIVADDLGLDPTPGYLSGPQKAPMSRLSTLMDNGLTFDNAWSMPVCSPTRSAMITGRQATETGVLWVDDPLLPSETTVFEYPTSINSGYASALIGKWHLGGSQPSFDDPGMQGVPHFTGILSGGVQDYFNWQQVTNGSLTNNSDYITEVLTDSAIAWINAQSQPWFCWLAYNAPHSPFHLPPQHLHSQGMLPTDTASINADPLPYYLAMVESMDSEIGRLLDAIPPAELSNTTILFIGDNGTPGEVVQSPYAPNKAKGSLYQGGINVPFVVSGAGVTRSGEREESLVSVTDLFSTIVELTGNDLSVYASSKSLVPTFTQGGILHRDCVRADSENAQGAATAVRNERYKLIDLPNGFQRFHDLLADPYENTNLLPGLTPAEQAAYDELSEGCTTIVQTAELEEESAITILPNPTSGLVRVQGMRSEGLIRVHDGLGRVVMQEVIRSTDQLLDLRGLAPGTYVLQGPDFAERFCLYHN
ncbi:MAG: sulfatase-like hydrolase/transferase [Flavobacteriales bacterium]|nr:sulfatase-like hydrolase/transferase [Flavobacteriales bacterium]